MRLRSVIPLLLLCCLVTTGCGDAIETTCVPVTLAGGHLPRGAVAVTHGGVGSPPAMSPPCDEAARAAIAALRAGQDVLDAAVVGTMVLEDNPLFNAGTGANIRLDGHTIQMDAAVMNGEGEFAAVAVIENVTNPVAVARAVLDTPHRMLAGEGATRFAHKAGFANTVPTCREAEDKYLKRIGPLIGGHTGGGYDTFDWRGYWNFPQPLPRGLAADAPRHEAGDADEAVDTVGTVLRDENGRFAATLSTGGTSITLYGRVGDVPIYGCGCYAGPDGAVACTGFGEEIIKRAMARMVYEMLAEGISAREAVRRGCEIFGEDYPLGLIAVGHDGWGVGANRQMAFGEAEG